MDVLARLRDDMDMVGCEAAGLGENVLDACLEILDEFIAGYEAASGIPAIEGDSVVLIDMAGVVHKIPSDATILVPRERKPGLLGAAERVVATRDDFENCRDALDALAAALQEEER